MTSILFAAIVGLTPAYAATYDEATDGDLADTFGPGPFPTFLLDPGLNAVSGTFPLDFEAGAFDSDGIRLGGQNLVLDSVSVDFIHFSSGTGISFFRPAVVVYNNILAGTGNIDSVTAIPTYTAVDGDVSGGAQTVTGTTGIDLVANPGFFLSIEVDGLGGGFPLAHI